MVPYAVICHWEFVVGNRWLLNQSYTIDCEGYPISINEDRDFCYNWTHKKISEEDYESIPDRAVTIWSIEGGISLFDFSPTISHSFTIEFYEEFKKNKNWARYINNGYQLYFKTVDEVNKYFGFKNAKTL